MSSQRVDFQTIQNDLNQSKTMVQKHAVIDFILYDKYDIFVGFDDNMCTANDKNTTLVLYLKGQKSKLKHFNISSSSVVRVTVLKMGQVIISRRRFHFIG